MTEPTDTNQASEDELVNEVADILNNNLHASCECHECVITWNDSDAIPLVTELIRTEKLKILDRLSSHQEDLFWWTGGEYEKTKAVDMRAIAAERERLTKLEALYGKDEK